MKILGIDPGYERLGWGIIEKHASTFSLIECGCITTAKTKASSERLAEIFSQLTDIVTAHTPDMAAIETLFFSKNKTTALEVAQARGVILTVLQREKIPINEFAPSQIKSSVTGNGQADKKMVEKMVRLQLHNVPAKLIDDTIDALAIALTGGNKTY